MNEIKVLGTGTSRQQTVVSTIKEYLEKSKLDITIREYNDIDAFLSSGIESIPAVIYHDKVHTIGTNGDFNKTLRETVNDILKENNYGDMEKIVIPVDFSDVSTNAFAYGHRLATDIKGITKAVHVFHPMAKELQEAAYMDVDIALLRESTLQEFIEKFDSDWGSDLVTVSLIDREFRVGFPGEEILDSIEENGSYLTIIGTTGKSGKIKQWMGSVSTHIMNESPNPVLIVPEQAKYKGVNKIAYAYDVIERDLKVAEDMVDMAKKFNSEIHLVHVENGGNPDPGYYIKEQIAKLYDPEKVFVHSVQNHDIINGLSTFCNQNDIDILAMSTYRKSFFDKVMDDNISKEMSMSIDVPLLVLKTA